MMFFGSNDCPLCGQFHDHSVSCREHRKRKFDEMQARIDKRKLRDDLQWLLGAERRDEREKE